MSEKIESELQSVNDETKPLLGGKTAAKTMYPRESCCTSPSTPFQLYIVMILYFVVISVNLLGVSDLLYTKVCFAHYGNITLCSNSTFTKSHPALQDEVTVWGNYGSLVQLLPCILSNLLLSNYCDKVGHKLPLILPVIGTGLGTSLIAVLSLPATISWSPGWVLIFSFLNSALGYFSLFLMSAFSYSALAVPVDKRHYNLAIAEGTVVAGVVIGTLISGPIIDAYGLDTMLFINCGTCVLVVMIIVFFVKDIPKEYSSSFKWRDIFSLSHMLDALKCVFKIRTQHSRILIHLSITAYCCLYVAVTGYTALMFLYFVKELGLSLAQFSYFTAIGHFIKAIFGPIVLILTKRIGIDPLTTGVVGAAMVALGYLLQSITTNFAILLAAFALLAFQSVVFAVIRALLASIVNRDELGKVFAYDAILQVILNTVSSLFFNVLYEQTLSFWPSMFLTVGGFLGFLTLIIMSVISFIKTRDDSTSSEDSLEEIC